MSGITQQLSRFFVPSLLASIFFWNAHAISQYGPLPNATMMASSSLVFLLVYAALRSRNHPIIAALIVCLIAFPGALMGSVLLYKVGALAGLTEAGYAALNSYVRGVAGSGAIALVYVVVKGLWVWRKHGIRRRHSNSINAEAASRDMNEVVATPRKRNDDNDWDWIVACVVVPFALILMTAGTAASR